METSRRHLIAMLALAGFFAPRAWAAAPQSKLLAKVRALRTSFPRKFSGDFDGMLERRLIRVVVPYSRTLFFQDKGAIYGTAAESAQLVETWINKTYALGARFLTMPISPVSREKLFDTLLAGDADLAMGNITITEERRKRVAFTTPVVNDVREVVITGQDVQDLDSPEALAGKEVAVGRSTSYYESLTKLNERLVAEGKPPVKITVVPDTLEIEDLMEMTAAGLLPATVADDWIANLWVQIFKGLKAHPKAVLREGAQIAWAIRPDNPKLLAVLNRAIASFAGNAMQWSARTQVYLASLKQLHTATGGADLQRFRDTVEIFRRYAGQYRFDTLILVALGYEESRLQQEVRSPTGAIGLMQVMPKTGQAMGVGDITLADPNVHAGTKLLATLADNYFQDATFDEQNRTLFAFASYGMGAGAVQWMRDQAAAQKLDPNVWFNNVERVAAAKPSGQETVRAVRNVYKYYIAYKLIEEANEAKKAAVDSAKPAAGEKPAEP